MFPKLDAIAAYCMVREYTPKRIIEVGSGASSHIMARAVADNQSGEIICIDPHPRREIEATGARIHRRALSESDIALLDDFSAGDILFIDSSHIMLPGMDVDILFNRFFPALPSGAIVHVHDIFLPDPYPASWFHRNYSESNALIGWIMSGYFQTIYPSYYVASRLATNLEKTLGDLFPSNPESNAGSIWLMKS